jgi:short subunit dehydrogenase-like uncharacterized protein
MPNRILLFGATGYTGRLTAQELVARGSRPTLAARNEEALKALSAELGGLEYAIADVSRPDTVHALVGQSDVLISTVGPFARWGGPALDAAIDAGAIYLDSTGESAFIREVFEKRDAPARASGASLLTAFGYDYVPGNLAASIALDRAGDRATKISVGYFMTGRISPKEAMSGGTAATLAEGILAPHFAFRDGRLQTERAAKRVRGFDARGKKFSAVSVGSSEHFTLPKIHQSLREVDAYLGWFGPGSKAMQGFSLLAEVPGVPAGSERLARRFVKGSRGGPDEAARAKTGSLIVAEASDASGNVIERVELDGPNGYTLTGAFLAWGAIQAAEHGVSGPGSLGPVQAYGLEILTKACEEMGLKEVGAPTTAA